MIKISQVLGNIVREALPYIFRESGSYPFHSFKKYEIMKGEKNSMHSYFPFFLFHCDPFAKTMRERSRTRDSLLLCVG